MGRLGFTYLYTNDLEAMKDFYKEILKLEVIWEEEEAIAFNVDGHQLSITYDINYILPTPHFAKQPGWEGGTQPRTSWSIEFEPEDYAGIIEEVKESELLTFYLEPQWVGYQSFPVLDPMNNTIELTCRQKND
jgi:extradiol dioxygenase family protein